MPHHDWMDFGFIELYFLYPPVCGVLLYRSRPKMAKNHLTKRFKTTIRQKVFESCANSFFDDTYGLKLFRNILIKFMFSKKATKIDKIFTNYLTVCSQINGEDFINFCGLLKNMNFNDVTNLSLNGLYLLTWHLLKSRKRFLADFTEASEAPESYLCNSQHQTLSSWMK